MQREVATQAVLVAEPRAVVARASDSLAEVDRVQEAVRAAEVTTVVAPELAYCLAMELATAMGLDQVPVSAAEQAAEVSGEAKLRVLAEEAVLAFANPAKTGSTAFCEP